MPLLCCANPTAPYNDWSTAVQGWAAGGLVLATMVFILAVVFQKRSLINTSALSRVTIVTILVVFLGVSVWNWPVADDWAMAHSGRTIGPFGFALESYQHWSGRFISSWLGASMGYLGDPVLVGRLFPVILVTALACGIAWTVRGLCPASSASIRWWTTGGLLVTWMVSMEWPAHGLFWFAATTNYAIGLPILMLLVGTSFQIPGWSRWKICRSPRWVVS